MKAPSVMAVAALAFASLALAQESKLSLVDAPGKEKAAQCIACHSIDYISMNSHFLDKAGWTAEVNKMVNAYGAPVAKADVEAIAEYLARNYGRAGQK